MSTSSRQRPVTGVCLGPLPRSENVSDISIYRISGRYTHWIHTLAGKHTHVYESDFEELARGLRRAIDNGDKKGRRYFAEPRRAFAPVREVRSCANK